MRPFWESAFFRSSQHSTNLTTRFHRVSQDSCENLSLRKPSPIMGVAKRWQRARTGMMVAECGTGNHCLL
jgi:hypothetical protein